MEWLNSIQIYKKNIFYKLLTAAWRYVGVNLTPSMKSVMGIIKMQDIIVIIENRVMLSRDSCMKTKCHLQEILWGT